MPVTEAELEAAAEAEEEAEAEAEELEFAAPQSGLVFRVTPSPLHRVVAKVMVAGFHFSCLWTSPL